MVGNHRNQLRDDAGLPSPCVWLEIISTIVISHSLWQLGDLKLFFSSLLETVLGQVCLFACFVCWLFYYEEAILFRIALLYAYESLDWVISQELVEHLLFSV